MPFFQLLYTDIGSVRPVYIIIIIIMCILSGFMAYRILPSWNANKRFLETMCQYFNIHVILVCHFLGFFISFVT